MGSRLYVLPKQSSSSPGMPLGALSSRAAWGSCGAWLPTAPHLSLQLHATDMCLLHIEVAEGGVVTSALQTLLVTLPSA